MSFASTIPDEFTTSENFDCTDSYQETESGILSSAPSGLLTPILGSNTVEHGQHVNSVINVWSQLTNIFQIYHLSNYHPLLKPRERLEQAIVGYHATRRNMRRIQASGTGDVYDVSDSMQRSSLISSFGKELTWLDYRPITLYTNLYGWIDQKYQYTLGTPTWCDKGCPIWSISRTLCRAISINYCLCPGNR